MTTIVNDISDVGIYNIVADQGTTFMRSITYQNSAGTAYNLGLGASAQMKVRKSYPATQNKAAYRDAAVLWLGSTGTGATTIGLTITYNVGKIDIKIPADTMANVPAGIYDYDLEIKAGSTGLNIPSAVTDDIIKVIRGLFEVRQEITY